MMEPNIAPLKIRVANLAPINGYQVIRQTCPELEVFCSPRPEIHNKVYITDDEAVYKWASKKLLVFRIFKPIYWLFRWYFDGNSFSPTWYSVLRVDEIVNKEHPIHVSDTLVVNCQSIESFERLIPYIGGDFSRLMIHGKINLDQLNRLLLAKVRKVVVTANIQLRSHEYGEAVRLIMGQVRGFRYNFKLQSNPRLINAIRAAVATDWNLATINSFFPRGITVIHWTRYLLKTIFALYQLYNSVRDFARIIRGNRPPKESTKTVPNRSCSECQPIPKDENDFFGWCCALVSVVFLLAFLGLAAEKTKPEDEAVRALYFEI